MYLYYVQIHEERGKPYQGISDLIMAGLRNSINE